jgi:uncharacterized membrane protein YgcG
MMINLKRVLKHLTATASQVRRAFPGPILKRIEHEIEQSEDKHEGEIRFAVETALSGPTLFLNQSARERAIDLFSQLRMWDTEHRNGVLIYLLMADKSVEIVADRGVNRKVESSEWRRICHAMELAFHEKNYPQGTIDGIREVNHILTSHFPANDTARNELSNKVILL